MWGWLLLGTHVFSAPAAVTMIFEIFSRVGSPTAEDAAYFASLPLWSTQLPQFPAQPLSRTIARKITQSCADLLQGLFHVSPRTRLAARDVTERLPKALYAQPASSGTDGVASPVVAPTAAEPDVATAASAGAPASGCASGAAPAPEPAGLALFSIASAASGNHADNTAALKMTLKQGPSGSTDFQGGRARFSLLVGNIGTDVLDWLCNGLEAMDDSAWGFGPEAEGKDRKVENGCKLEIAVHLLKTNKSSKLSLNGLACYHPAPVAWRAWVLAFKERTRMHWITCRMENVRPRSRFDWGRTVFGRFLFGVLSPGRNPETKCCKVQGHRGQRQLLGQEESGRQPGAGLVP